MYSPIIMDLAITLTFFVMFVVQLAFYTRPLKLTYFCYVMFVLVSYTLLKYFYQQFLSAEGSEKKT